MLGLLNLFMPNERTLSYQLEVHSRFKGCWAVFFMFIQFFIEHSISKQWRLETLIGRHSLLWRLIWICTVYLCLTERMLGLYGLTWHTPYMLDLNYHAIK